MTVPLSASLPTGDVPGPGYDRDAARVGIVHIGVGNFHRSHQAMYLDRLMERGEGLDWGICGVGVLPHDATMRDALRAQDGLYTLVVRHEDGSLEPRVIGSLLEYLLAPENPDAVFARLVDPAVRIVSLTVTEGGYLRDAATGEFDPTDAAVVRDAQHPRTPTTAFGYLVEGLRRRRAAGVPPFAVLSCDNLQGNGAVCRATVVGLARLGDPELADWIDAEVAFPNCMVDRITPATTDADRAVLADEFGITDRWPVPAEPFTQWIVEDEFPLGRPELEKVDVQFVDDVGPYELMKLRLLNASHQAIAYLGAPLGHVLVDEAMRDDRIRDYLLSYMADEAAPTLGDLPGIDLPGYMTTLVDRFSNPGIKDTLVRLATDGANRMAGFTLPPIRENLAAGRPVRLGALMVAAWAEYWALIARDGLPAEAVPPDVHADALRAAAAAEDPAEFLGLDRIFGELGRDETFRGEFLRARSDLREHGVHGAVDAALGRG